MKPFSKYTDPELLTIGNQELNDAIRIEAIERGIKPPVTLPEALRQSEWRGYQKPAEAIRVFRIRCGYTGLDFGWLDESKALAALDGLVKIETIGYSENNGHKIGIANATVESVWVGVSKAESKAAKFEEFFEDTTEFDKVRDECIERFEKVRQDDYNRRVLSEKRAEYLRLAGGDEAIAAAFWAKTERTEWPAS